ncbi:hypothetical protein PI93_003840 [Pandoraea fibrosis]|uniref:Imm33-like domain-containing protein n=1 Tax=Pandoraea fibrosis TaxID=1891094 RepID=A0ABX6HMV3_9BURK|nr:hypothetical protein [Pandoraea fibrosis]QHE91043.1 hypothetical protein PJ20_003840 [Pandoraea fibrosis]QHF11874.1 hypothetical protein PI93_003840 [Pandoraea fibrosis]
MATLIRPFGEKRVRINFDGALEQTAEAVVNELHRQYANGMVLADGLRIRFGWSFLILLERHGEVVICEPDYGHNPFAQTRDDVSIFLRVLAAQSALTKMLGVAPTDISFQDKIIFADGVFDASQMYAERIEPQQDDSGWFFGYTEGDNSPENLRGGYVFQLLTFKPILMQTLLLPAGSMVMLENDQIRDILGQDNTSLLERR